MSQITINSRNLTEIRQFGVNRTLLLQVQKGHIEIIEQSQFEDKKRPPSENHTLLRTPTVHFSYREQFEYPPKQKDSFFDTN
jgi:hypothetical protein